MNAPTYIISLLPFIGLLSDGKEHSISIKVEGAQVVWLTSANLQCWLNPSNQITRGGVLHSSLSELSPIVTETGSPDTNGTLAVSVTRHATVSGYVLLSGKRVKTVLDYDTFYHNIQVFTDAPTLGV
jgi:hypothetical protein